MKTKRRLREMGFTGIRAVRRFDAGHRELPSFLIIGAQRAGTTSLYRWICSQKGVRPALRKEVRFFDLNYRKGPRWYRTSFPRRHDGFITGEASPYMLFHPLSPQRAAEVLPSDTRYIALLRNPVDRALSHFRHETRMGYETESLETALELEIERLTGAEARVMKGEYDFAHQHHSYLARGDYARQLERWFERHDHSNVLVMESERVFSSVETQDEVLAFLGLSRSGNGFPQINASEPQAVDGQTRKRLEEHFAPLNEELFGLLGDSYWSSGTKGP